MNTRRALLAAMILLTAILACAVPGLPAASQPTPTVDTRLDTMVAETVSAALAQTQQAIPTPTIPPTATLEPTITPTPEADTSGSSLTEMENGSTLFSDFNAGYEVNVPAGWLAVRINQQEYLDAWLLAEFSNPAMQRSLSSIENLNPNELRLYAVDLQADHARTGFITNINFIWYEQDDMSLDDDTDLLAVSAALPNALPGLELLTTELTATANGLPIGVNTSKTPVTTLDNVSIVIFQKQVFIKARAGTLTITLSTTEELKDTILPAFDAMIESIKVSD
ncbi:MAG: hypothetical protein HZB18_01875 [Chloroflexi bacterium]|nr:hypothetical protein [Chloroflexota bacterium]